MHSVKNKFPFRLGCTSYVYPDAIVPNVEKLASFVDDIELVLFESGERGTAIDRAEVTELARLRDAFGITYTVHFPIDKKAGSPDIAQQDGYVRSALDIIDKTECLLPYGYVLHLEGVEYGSDAEQRKHWHERCAGVCEKIAQRAGAHAQRVCVENLFYPPEWHDDLVRTNGFGRCLDFGHLFLCDASWKNSIVHMAEQSSIVHFHGVWQSKDHLSLKKGNLPDILFVLDCLRKCSYDRCLTLEVFGENDTFESLEEFERLWHR